MNIELLIQEGFIIYKWLRQADRIFSEKLTKINIRISILSIFLSLLDNILINKILLYFSIISLIIFSIIPKILYALKKDMEQKIYDYLLSQKEKNEGYLLGIDSRELDAIVDYLSIKNISNDSWTQIKIKSAPYLYLWLYFTTWINLLLNKIKSKTNFIKKGE